jgi:esterase/lipase superfamily enzyme
MKHFIITNRLIETRNGEERINEDGREEAKDAIRFAEYDTDTNTYNLFPEPQPTEPLERISYKYKVIDNNDDFLLDENNNQVAINSLHGSVRTFTLLYKLMKQSTGGDVLFFIHGFNTDLNKALEALQNLHLKYVQDTNSPIKHIVMFTWPAKSSLLEYRDDYQDAVLSGYPLARLFLKLKTFYQDFIVEMGNAPCNRKINLLCHSMGATVLESMQQNLLSLLIPLNVILNKVILAAADVDWTAFEEPQPLYNLIDICESVHIYIHKEDRALGISETTKNPANRLGKHGPKNKNRLSSNISCIDVSNVPSGDDNNHGYFLSSPKVVKDVLEVFKQTGRVEPERVLS